MECSVCKPEMGEGWRVTPATKPCSSFLTVRDAEYARLQGLQVEWVQALTSQPWGHRAFYVRDPDGNILNLHTAVEEQSG